MKKTILVLLALSILFSSPLVLPQTSVIADNGDNGDDNGDDDQSSPLGKVELPSWLTWTKAHPGVSGINLLINNLVRLIFIVAVVGLFFMFLWGGLRYIFSQGDKAQTEAARSTITNALIGFTIVATSFALMRLVETFFGISIISRSPAAPPPPAANCDLSGCIDWTGYPDCEAHGPDCQHRQRGDDGPEFCCHPDVYP